MNQFGLPFDWPAEEETTDFIVTEANHAAVRHLESPGSWPVRVALLTGPRKSGKSLLGRIFAARTQANVIDDADQRPEDMVFHAWNSAQENRTPLLLIAENAPPLWAVRLPDLRSRLHATPVLHISAPDVPLAEALLVKLLAKRGLALMADSAAYAAARLERSYIALERAADAIDAASLSQKRAITLPLVRQALESAHLIDSQGGRREHSGDEAEID